MKRLFQFVLLLAALAWCVPAHAVQTLVHSTSGCASASSPCALTVPSTTAGNLLIGVAGIQGTTKTMTSISGGTSVHPASCAGSDSNNVGSSDLAYVLSATGGTTSITFTSTGNTFNWVMLLEYSGSTIAFDVCNHRNVTTAGANLAGISAGTLTGTNDIIIQWARFGSKTPTGCPNSAASPATFGAQKAVCGLINSTTNAAGNYANTSDTAAESAVAFKDTGGGAAKTAMPVVY